MLISNGSEEELPSKFNRTIHRGDVFRHFSPGGGGFGDPLDREPALVARDIRNRLVSAGRARGDYGVVLSPAGDVDLTATESLRKRLRAPSPPW